MGLTKYERIMKTAGLVYSVMFLLTAVFFFVGYPEFLFVSINTISQMFFPSLPQAADTGKFWLSMTVSMMAGVTAASWMIFRDVKKHHTMAIPLCAMKFTSALAGISFFTVGCVFTDRGWNTLANAAIFITDFPLGLFILFLYIKVRDGE